MLLGPAVRAVDRSVVTQIWVATDLAFVEFVVVHVVCLLVVSVCG
jgi:hypothetical protein